MTQNRSRNALKAVLLLGSCSAANAHITYTNRNFGRFSGGEVPATISNVTVGNNFSWADGTDEDWGSSEPMRAFRFTLTYDARVTIEATATTNAGALLGDLLPGFSIYSGLVHVAPALSDHDTATISQAWLAAQGGVKEGNFRALGDWRVGNDDGLTFDDLSTLIFKGYAVDGTAANFGSAPGVIGDGLADGRVSGTFNLTAGNYTILVGGADYAAQAGGVAGNRGLNMTITVVPEPGSMLLGVFAGVFLCGRRRRSK